MIIGIDASRYNIVQKTGVEVYSMKIIEGLIKIAKKKSDINIVLYSRNPLPRKCGSVLQKDFLKKKNFTVGQRILRFRRLWTQFRLSLEMHKNPPDVLFVPSHTLPIIHPRETIITIHDVAFVFFRKAYSFFQYYYLYFSTKYACKHASKIIVPSQATKDDLKSFFNCPEEKIVVIPHGIDFEWKKEISEKEEHAILHKFGLLNQQKYIFFVGRLESKKNLENIISAYHEYKTKYDCDLKFVLAGKPGIGYKKIIKTIKANHLENDVLMPGYVNEIEKEVLLKYSKAFIFVSLYEGFGFPILEAFRDRIPVITANISAMKEVAGEAAFRVNPFDIQEIVKSLYKILHDDTARYYMISKGEERLKDFNWEDTAKKTFHVIQETAKEN